MPLVRPDAFLCSTDSVLTAWRAHLFLVQTASRANCLWSRPLSLAQTASRAHLSLVQTAWRAQLPLA